MDAPELLGRQEAARLIGVAPATLRKWWSANRGPRGVKLSDKPQGKVLYPRGELVAWSRDPLAYERSTRPATVPRFNPPPQRRGGDRG